MAITYYPFDGQSTTEDQYSKLFRELQDSGVADSADGPGLLVTANGTGMQVTVAAGLHVVRGHVYWSTAPQTISIGAASAQARIDTVILRLDPSSNTIALVVAPGDPAAGVAPTLNQTDVGVWEQALADVAVAAGATAISSDAITDRRRFLGMRIGVWKTISRPASPRLSRPGYNIDLQIFEVWNGTDWKPLTVSWTSLVGRPKISSKYFATPSRVSVADTVTTIPISVDLAGSTVRARFTGVVGGNPSGATVRLDVSLNKGTNQSDTNAMDALTPGNSTFLSHVVEAVYTAVPAGTVTASFIMRGAPSASTAHVRGIFEIEVVGP